VAATVKEQRIVDSNKRSLIKYTINSDGVASANNGLVDVSTLAYALNTNGYIMSANADPKSSYRVAVKRVFGSVANTTTGLVTLKWQGPDATFLEIMGLAPGNFDISFGDAGDGAVIPNPIARANANGDICFSSTLPAGAFATIFLELRKEGEDYDQGQTRDPRAFNR
jgi:hypothetical protein